MTRIVVDRSAIVVDRSVIKRSAVKRLFAERTTTNRRGISLMEVILSIAILGGSMVAVGELVRIGSRAAAGSRELNKAQIHCQTLLNEYTSGLRIPQTTGLTPYEYDPEWQYAVEVFPIDTQPGLVMLRITVQQNLNANSRPISTSLIRWIPDPGIEFDEETGEATAPTSTATGGGNG